MKTFKEVIIMHPMEIADSYYRNGDKLIYSTFSNTFLSGGEIYDPSADMRGRIDCSTFIHLVLQGIHYDHSPYATGSVDSFFEGDHPHGDGELLRRLKNGEPARFSYQLGEYYVLKKQAVFSDKNWKSGDLLFFKAPEYSRKKYIEHGCFMEISHVAIVADDPKYIYESTGSQLLHPEKNITRPGVTKTLIRDKRAPLFYVPLR